MNPLLAVGQITSTSDREANFDACARIVEEAARRGAAMLCLPENFAFMGEHDGDGLQIAESLDGTHLCRYRDLARRHGLWLSLGGYQETFSSSRIHNTHVVVDSAGTIRAAYRKIHLFDVDLPNGSRLRESAFVQAGEDLVVADGPAGLRMGLSICYDVRFPDLYAGLRELGAEVLLIPAAFTMTTGKDHWEVLLRARAIETQCYVAAAAQDGFHNPRRESYGNAMIVDPWGRVIARCSEANTIACAAVDPALVQRIRQRMPVWQHRRAMS